MNVLAIETSGRTAEAAACRDEEVLAEEALVEGAAYGRLLLPLVDRVVTRAGWDKRRDIHLVAVSQGPGSFTGLRVGLTFAKTLAQLQGAALLGVCSFDAMARNAPVEAPRVLTVLDAKRGDVYAAGYERRQGVLARVWGPETIKPEAAAKALGAPYVVLGDGLRHHADRLLLAGCAAGAEDLWRPRASVVARLAWADFSAGRRDDALTLEPIYLRRPEAEEKRLAREQRSISPPPDTQHPSPIT